MTTLPVFVKVVLLGDPGVGKTSLVHSLLQEQSKVSPTRLVERSVALFASHGIYVHFYDLGGSLIGGSLEDEELLDMHLVDAEIVCFVCDVTDVLALQKLSRWMHRVPQSGTELRLLLGNKNDCELARNCSPATLERFAEVHGFHHWGCVSAKKRESVERVFKQALDMHLRSQPTTPAPPPNRWWGSRLAQYINRKLRQVYLHLTWARKLPFVAEAPV